MANKTIDQLDSATAADVDNADLFLIFDGANPPKNITREELAKGLFGAGTEKSLLVSGGSSNRPEFNDGLYWDDTNKRLGIGTSNPNRALDVQEDTGDAAIRVYTNGTDSADDSMILIGIAGTDATTRINFGDGDDIDVGRIIYNHSADYMALWVNASEAIRIGSSGQIGIGGASYGSAGQVLTSNGGGSAPSWQPAGGGGAARVWANWDLTTTLTIRDSIGVSSMVDDGVGRTTINFQDAFANTGYAVIGGFERLSRRLTGPYQHSDFSTTAVELDTVDAGGSYNDGEINMVSIFGDLA